METEVEQSQKTEKKGATKGKKEEKHKEKEKQKRTQKEAAELRKKRYHKQQKGTQNRGKREK